jgi:formate/nitrite transporter FocA (FNT family)
MCFAEALKHRFASDDRHKQWFLAFMGATMFGFAFAFYALFRHDRDAGMDFTNFYHACASMVSYLLAMCAICPDVLV